MLNTVIVNSIGGRDGEGTQIKYCQEQHQGLGRPATPTVKLLEIN